MHAAIARAAAAVGGAKNVFVIGESHGACVALDAALTYPADVGGLNLVSACSQNRSQQGRRALKRRGLDGHHTCASRGQSTHQPTNPHLRSNSTRSAVAGATARTEIAVLLYTT